MDRTKIIGFIIAIFIVIIIVISMISSNNKSSKIQRPAIERPSVIKPPLVIELPRVIEQTSVIKLPTTIEQSPAIKLPPTIKFIKGQNKNTEYNSYMNTFYLDRHNINCESNPINNFKIELSDDKTKLRYNYGCAEGGDLGDKNSKDSSFNDAGNGTIVYLDRHNIDCGSNALLNNFQLTRKEGDTNSYRYNYNCLNSNQPLTCRKVQSAQILGVHGGNTDVFKLSNANIKCNEDEALSRFKLFRPDGNSVQYEYNCCKY